MGEFYHFSCACFVVFLSIEILSRLLTPSLFGRYIKNDKQRIDFCERIVSQTHALILLFGASRVIYHLKDHGIHLAQIVFSFVLNQNAKLPKDIIVNKSQENDIVQLALLYISFSVGYFIWDLSGCMRDFKRLGLAFTIHAFCGVVGLGMALFPPYKSGVLFYACGVFLFGIYIENIFHKFSLSLLFYNF